MIKRGIKLHDVLIAVVTAVVVLLVVGGVYFFNAQGHKLTGVSEKYIKQFGITIVDGNSLKTVKTADIKSYYDKCAERVEIDPEYAKKYGDLIASGEEVMLTTEEIVELQLSFPKDEKIQLEQWKPFGSGKLVVNGFSMSTHH